MVIYKLFTLQLLLKVKSLCEKLFFNKKSIYSNEKGKPYNLTIEQKIKETKK